MNENNQDFPLEGFVGKVVRKLVPQRDPNLSQSLVKLYPGQAFTGVVKTIFKEKNMVKYAALGYCFEAIFSSVYTLLPLILGQFVALFLEDDAFSSADMVHLMTIVLIMMTCAITTNLLSIRYADRVRATGEALTRRQLTWWALGHSAGWFAVREAGQIGYRISEVSRQISDVFGFIIWQASPAVVSLTVVTIVMFATDLYAGIFFLIWASSFLYISIRLGLISQKFMMRIVKRRAQASGLVMDSIINHSLVRLFEARMMEDQNVDIHSSRCYEAFMESTTWAMVKNLIRDLWITVMLVSMISILSYGFMSERITAAAFVGGMGTIFVLIAQIRSLHHVIRDMMNAIGAAREGLIEIGTHHDIPEKNKSHNIALTDKKITITGLNFSYHNDRAVLKDINLVIPDGQKVGLIGPSGAGKTTLTALLLRLWDIEDGEIQIGTQNIKDLSFASIRHNIALIPQDTSLFHRSLMENIRYGRLKASDEEVIEAAKRAHAHEFITELPDGYETLVGERGVKLSGGQRQRIAIARAILKDAPILILDEATSALDSESEKLIQDSLKDLMEGKTVIAIAHRLSTIAHLDRLIVMDKGKIVEDGTHEELLKQEGLYAKLWAMQSGGFLG